MNSSLRLSRPSPFAAPNSRSVPKFDHSRLFTLLLNDARATLPHGRPRPRPSPDAASPPSRRGRTRPAPSSCATLATSASEESRARFHESPSTEHQSPLHLPAFSLRLLGPSVAPPICVPFVFILLRLAFPATPFFSQPSALPRGCGVRTSVPPLRVSVPLWQSQFARPLFSYSYELLFPQVFYFDNDPHCPGVWGTSGFLSNFEPPTSNLEQPPFARFPRPAYTSKARRKTPCSACKHFAPKCVRPCASLCHWFSPRLAG